MGQSAKGLNLDGHALCRMWNSFTRWDGVEKELEDTHDLVGKVRPQDSHSEGTLAK